MVNGFRKLVAIVKQPVVFGIHHFGNGDFNTQIPLMLEAVIAGIYFFPGQSDLPNSRSFLRYAV